LAHVPEVLPSHLDHPQWDYHRPGFTEARHKYLSARLGSATEENEPPASLSAFDKVWWRLDGLGKAHARRRAELTALMGHQREVVAEVLRQLEEGAESGREALDERLAEALGAMRSDPYNPAGVELNRVVRCRPEAGVAAGPGPGAAGAAPEGPWVAPILHGTAAWLEAERATREKKELLGRAVDFIERHHKDRLMRLELEYESARWQLQADYDRLMKRRIASAAIPHVVVRHGPQTALAPAPAGLPVRLARRLYHRYYGKLPRLQPLHPYWAAMRHLIQVVDRATQAGAANVLVVVGGPAVAVADRVADHLPGLHAQVSLSDVMQGNLIKAFSRSPELDLCICTLGAAEIDRFADLVKNVAPCMRRGGKIVGFYPNFGLAAVAIDELELLRGMFDFPWSGRVYYAGSAKSARVVRRYHQTLSASSRSRVAAVVRMATRLFLVTPSALAANRAEAAAPEDQSARLPDHCTSITIEVTL